MNVSSVAHGQYAAQQSCAGNKTSNFADVLQEKLQESSLQKNSGQEIPKLERPLLYACNSDGSLVLGSSRTFLSGSRKTLSSGEDMELHASVLQLGVELGTIEKSPSGFPIFKEGYVELIDALQELLNDGSISREDIINAVKYPPKIHFDNLNFIGGEYVTNLNYNGFGTTEPIAFSSASELFEKIWGKKEGDDLV